MATGTFLPHSKKNSFWVINEHLSFVHSWMLLLCRLRTWSMNWRKQKGSAVSLLLSCVYGRISSISLTGEGYSLCWSMNQQHFAVAWRLLTRSTLQFGGRIQQVQGWYFPVPMRGTWRPRIGGGEPPKRPCRAMNLPSFLRAEAYTLCRTTPTAKAKHFGYAAMLLLLVYG
jgi:hypothetical protein